MECSLGRGVDRPLRLACVNGDRSPRTLLAELAGLRATLAAGAAQPQQPIANLDVSQHALTRNEA